VLKVYFERCCIVPRQKVLNGCKLKVYYKKCCVTPRPKIDSTGYTAIGQSGRLQLFFLQKSISFTTDSTGRKLKWLLKKVSAFATYDLYLFYVIEWLNNENIPS